MNPIVRCSCCKDRAALALTGKKGTPAVRFCAKCDHATEWPIHKKRKGKK